jgi:hypothetical protein
MTIMFGPAKAKNYINDFLEIDIPKRIINYRNEWNLDDFRLPDIAKFMTYEPMAMDTWPVLITVAISTKSFNRESFTPGNDPTYRVIYGMRSYVWVRAQGSDEVTFMRDNLTTVLRSALLDYPSFKSYDKENTFQAVMNESTLTEEFSDLTLIKGDRVLAGAYLSYDLAMTETVTRQPIGTVNEIDVSYTNINSIPENENGDGNL